MGLTVPMKRPKCGRPWLNDGACFGLSPEYRIPVWPRDLGHRPHRMGGLSGVKSEIHGSPRETKAEALRNRRRAYKLDHPA